MLLIGILLAAIVAIEIKLAREERAQRRRHGGMLTFDTPAARKALRARRRPW